MGFNQTYAKLCNRHENGFLDTTRNKFLPGNHDYYPELLPNAPTTRISSFMREFAFQDSETFAGINSDGEFASKESGKSVLDFAYVRGAWSIDRNRRSQGIDWFPEEQLSAEVLDAKCTEISDDSNCYEFIVSHDGPNWVCKEMFGYTNTFVENRTSAYFDELSRNIVYSTDSYGGNYISPHYWVFGHHHKTRVYKERGVTFICVGENAYVDIVF
jgi:hypothetical protein